MKPPGYRHINQGETESCETCGAFSTTDSRISNPSISGWCRMYDQGVSKTFVCTSWYARRRIRITKGAE